MQIDLAKYLADKSAYSHCLVCKDSQWTFIGERAMLKPSDTGIYSMSCELEKFLVFECDSCGFIKTIRTGTLTSNKKYVIGDK